jgi:hypothetical protein
MWIQDEKTMTGRFALSVRAYHNAFNVILYTFLALRRYGPVSIYLYPLRAAITPFFRFDPFYTISDAQRVFFGQILRESSQIL